MLKLGNTFSDNSTAIVFVEDYEKFINGRHGQNRLSAKFLDAVKATNEIVLDKAEHLGRFSENEIKELIQMGLLAVHRMVGKFLISLPGAAQFINSHTIGRKALTRIIRSSKFGEVLEVELLRRKVPQASRFDMNHFLLDMSGSSEIVCIQTSTGRLFRCV